MTASYRLADLARHVEGEVRGDGEREIRGLATLEAAGPDELSFFTNPRYRRAARATRAGALLVRREEDFHGRDLLVAAEPYLALARLLELFYPPTRAEPAISERAAVADSAIVGSGVSIGPFAVVEEHARLADGAVIGPGAVVGRGCRVGQATELRPGAVLYPDTRVGARCLIHAGVVLGGDGYGFATVGGRHHKIPQTGRVTVGDDVEIGANSTVDRGALGATEIGDGAKIDNLVMIAHGVRLGGGALLAAQAGIAGSTRTGEGVVFAGQSGAAGHLELGRGTVVAAKSAVFDDTADGAFVSGIPAVDHREWKRAQALVRRLPELRKKIRQLEHRLGELEAAVQTRRTEEDDG